MKQYADDYELITVEDEHGREKRTAVYRGSYYEILLEAAQLVRFRRNSLLLLGLILLAHTGAGFIANPGMNQFYVLLPYAFVFLPLYYLGTGMLRLPKSKRLLRRDEVGLSIERFQKASVGLFLLLIAVVIGATIFLIGFAQDQLWLEGLFLALEVLALGCAYQLMRTRQTCQVRVVEPEK